MRNVYQAFYTESDSIQRYMVDKLRLSPGLRVLEPSAGEGAFVDAILKVCPDAQVDAYELNPDAVPTLSQKYAHYPNIRVIHGDTLTDPSLLLLANAGGCYDRVIANPPYGGWQEYDKRRLLKSLFPEMYVKDTYALFLFRALTLLNEGGILSFIMPDTFLNLHMHTALRKFLLTNARIVELAVFPSSFFPGVNFGYANLCILTAERRLDRRTCLDNEIGILSGFRSVSDLRFSHASARRRLTVKQSDVYHSLDSAFFLDENPRLRETINSAEVRLGDVAECVTGIYTGDDTQYLRPARSSVRNAKAYLHLREELLVEPYEPSTITLDGTTGPRCFVPLVKGGAARYWKEDTWYIDWSQPSVLAYKKNKKARFQNSAFYFRRGIAVPMVSSSTLSAWIIDGRVFDQSIVGVFPREENLINYIVGFLNTPTANALIRTINPSANNSANYLKKIPLRLPPEHIHSEINGLVEEQIAGVKRSGTTDEHRQALINQLVSDRYGF